MFENEKDFVYGAAFKKKRKQIEQQMQDAIFDEIKDERTRQNKKFGVQNHDVFLWLAILGEEKGECDNAAIEMKFTGSKTIQDLRTELVQVAAVAVQIIEWIDRTLADGEKQKLINCLKGDK